MDGWMSWMGGCHWWILGGRTGNEHGTNVSCVLCGSHQYYRESKAEKRDLNHLPQKLKKDPKSSEILKQLKNALVLKKNGTAQ